MTASTTFQGIPVPYGLVPLPEFPDLTAALDACERAKDNLGRKITALIDHAFGWQNKAAADVLHSYVLDSLASYKESCKVTGHLVLRTLTRQAFPSSYREVMRKLIFEDGVQELEAEAKMQLDLQLHWIECIETELRDRIEQQTKVAAADVILGEFAGQSPVPEPFPGAKAQMELALEQMTASYDVTDPAVIARSLELLDRADIALSNVMYGTKLIKFQPSEVQLIAAVRSILQVKAGQVRVFRQKTAEAGNYKPVK